jgi:homoserine/homoserine lactone efflux protein
MARGWKAGLAAGLGVQAGNGVYFLVSVFGLGAALAASELFFQAVKWAGAAYLVYLGVRTILAAREDQVEAMMAARPALWRRPFAQAAVNQLANPKSILFFGALLPQFVTPGRTSALDLAVLAATRFVIEMPILAAYAWAAARGGSLLRSPRQIVWGERLSGAALVAVGGLLAVMRRAAA